MSNTMQKVLRFVLKSPENPMALMARFHPQGITVLNRTEWRGKEPRSCGVTKMNLSPEEPASEPRMFKALIEVAYRPKGCITYVGQTKYDGWTALMLDRRQDGVLLDGHGNPLPDGQSPVYLPFELFNDVDFNEIDFGEFIGEFEVEEVKHVDYAEVWKQFMQSPHLGISMNSTFIAPRRHRPLVKLVLSSSPSGTSTDGFGTRIVNINNFTPQLQQVLLDELTQLVSGFIEGRYSIKNINNKDFVFAELSDVLVDCTPNEKGMESRFNCLKEYLSETYLDDLAKQLMATYHVDVSVVEGDKIGLLLRKTDERE